MSSDRRIIKEYLENIDIEDLLNGTPIELINRIKATQDKYKDRDIYFYADQDIYDGRYEIALWETRLEMDKEYADRLKNEAKYIKAQSKIKEKKEANERKEYERLKKKFG